MFGAGIYFAEHSSKSNQYVYGIGGGSGCAVHRDPACALCERTLLVCRVVLGKPCLQTAVWPRVLLFVHICIVVTVHAPRVCCFLPPPGPQAHKIAHAPPGHHSIYGKPTPGGLVYPEHIIYRGEQAYPEFIVHYHILPWRTYGQSIKSFDCHLLWGLMVLFRLQLQRAILRLYQTAVNCFQLSSFRILPLYRLMHSVIWLETAIYLIVA